jgi:RNA polymerase sigma factor (sigma-70 family)
MAAVMRSRLTRRVAFEEMSDARLVAMALGESDDAFVALYRRHVGAVRRALSDHVHDPERRRDLVQEAFTRALAKLPTLREASLFRPWVLQIARNAAIDDLRSRSHARLEPIDDERWMPACSDDGPGPVAEARDLTSAIQASMATLSARDAAAISMVAHLGFGPAEVAAVLDVSYGNAKVVVHRARSRLRQALALRGMYSAPPGQATGRSRSDRCPTNGAMLAGPTVEQLSCSSARSDNRPSCRACGGG